MALLVKGVIVQRQSSSILRSGTFLVYCFPLATSGSKFGNVIEPAEDTNSDHSDVDAVKSYRNNSIISCNGIVIK